MYFVQDGFHYALLLNFPLLLNFSLVLTIFKISNLYLAILRDKKIRLEVSVKLSSALSFFNSFKYASKTKFRVKELLAKVHEARALEAQNKVSSAVSYSIVSEVL